SDAVIPLISELSIKSEMLDYEVQVANTAAQDQKGRPRILPIRVDYSGPLPQNLASILDSRQYFIWKTPGDDQQLIEEVVLALHTPLRRWKDKDELEAIGGAVPIDSKYYVERAVDADFKRAVSQKEPIILIKGARQMGKTSLLARGLNVARDRGSIVALTDFQKFNAAQLETVESFFIALGEILADQLGLSVYPQDRWDSRRGPNLNFNSYIRREVLGSLNQPLVWAMDEVDRLFNRDYKSEVFGLFRSWHNERALNPAGPWGNLTLAIAYATEAHHFITDMNQSPFNVGLRLELEEFTEEQVTDLNRRHGLPLQEGHEILDFYKLTGGQPFLVRRGLYELVAHQMTLADFVAKADQDNGPYGDHLRRIYSTLVKNPAYTKIMTEILNGETCSDAESFYSLRSVGILVGASFKEAQLRNEIYTSYLKRLLQ
ncbi:MAG TPA: AAA-like domain-containing protein, partial [Bacillota bacterium]|nr:AAA-like domain-containing protein [Bacillota bacterium]